MSKLDNPTDVALEPFDPFAILTSRLVLLPTPVAISSNSYRALYAKLHADADFCRIAFGSHFPAQNWDDNETRNVIRTRDIARCWDRRGMGDFAVGLRRDDFVGHKAQSPLDYELMDQGHVNSLPLEEIEWIGYAGIRDATTTSLPPREPGDPALPPWQEMVEVRYGIRSEFWGKGIAREASQAIMMWGSIAKGVKKFIAETENGNFQSARVLQKLGFVRSDTHYWKEPNEIEWVLVAPKVDGQESSAS